MERHHKTINLLTRALAVFEITCMDIWLYLCIFKAHKHAFYVLITEGCLDLSKARLTNTKWTETHSNLIIYLYEPLVVFSVTFNPWAQLSKLYRKISLNCKTHVSPKNMEVQIQISQTCQTPSFLKEKVPLFAQQRDGKL